MTTPAEKPGFMRTLEHQLEIGDTLADFVVGLSPTYAKVRLHDLIADHLILILASTSCSACESALEALYERVSETGTPAHNIVLLIEASGEEVAEMRTIFRDRIRVFGVTTHLMREHLHMRYLPFGYCLVGEGIIAAMNIVSSREALEQLMAPVPEPRRVPHEG